MIEKPDYYEDKLENFCWSIEYPDDQPVSSFVPAYKVSPEEHIRFLSKMSA